MRPGRRPLPARALSLKRFAEAQAGVHERALAELRAGRKTSHWMWFVFPQLRGLGQSPTAQHYGIDGIGEAMAYLDHPVLGPRLLECAETVAATHGASAVDIFGTIDAMKLRSSMTLFARAVADNGPFVAVLGRFFDGVEDERTLALLAAS